MLYLKYILFLNKSQTSFIFINVNYPYYIYIIETAIFDNTGIIDTQLVVGLVPENHISNG